MGQINEHQRLEEKKLPASFDYWALEGLSIEARQRLSRVMPRSLGQASRVSGVSPADISVLMIYLEQRRREGKMQDNDDDERSSAQA